MKRLVLSFCALALTLTISAQGFGGGFGGGSSIKGKITGKIIDSENKSAIEFGTVVLLNSKTQKEVDGVITDEKGEFKLTDVQLGTYDLVCSFLGYATDTIAAVELTKKKPDLDLGKILLEGESVNLSEVVVAEEANLIENKIDKIVYNAEKDVANAGGDAVDVLRRVPMLSVDLEGNVSMRGSQNIRILINGRPSGMFASSVGDALKTIPADQIKSVEVVTTPTAKYDGEGTGGIINIITKKKSVEGFSGSVNASVGNVQNNGVLSLSASKGRFGMNANGAVYFSWPQESLVSAYREDNFTEITRIQETTGTGESQYTGFNGSVSAFYDLNAYNSISSNFRMNGRRHARSGTNFNDFKNATGDFFFENTYDNVGLYSGYDWNTDFKRTFEDSEREFVVAVQLSGNIDDRESDLYQTSNLANLQLDEFANNDGKNLETTLQVDYVHPFNESLKLEIGAKTIMRRIKTDYTIFDNIALAEINDPLRNNILNYDQDVVSGYASFNIKFGKKYGLVVGARYENTQVDGSYNNELEPFDNKYYNILPSIILSRSFKNFKTLKLSYNQRIQRPSLFYVNPYTDRTDSQNILFGNPDLSPEITDQIELSYNTFIKGVGLNGGIFYRRTSDIIESYFQNVNADGQSQTSFRNIGENNSFGFNFFSSVTIKRNFTLRAGGTIFSYDATSEIDGVTLNNTASQWNAFSSASANLKHGIKIEAFGFINSPRQTIQGITPSFSIFGMGAQKDIFNKKGSIGIRVIEPFAKYKSFGSELKGDQFYYESDFRVLFRSFGVNFKYRFGKLDFQQRDRKSKIKNSDLKQGEGGGGGQGGGGFGGN